jgi:hypothetical protein
MPRARSSIHECGAIKESALECLLAIKRAELYAVEDLLRSQPTAWPTFAPMRPDEWVQRLAEVKLLHDYAGHMADSFEALVRDAHLPHKRQ